MMQAAERRPARMRVLTVARWYPSHDSPGRGSFVADLVRATVEAGVEARVVSFDRVLVRGRLEARDADRAAARGAYDRIATPATLFAVPRSHGAPGVPVARLPVVRRPGAGDAGALVEDHLDALRPFVRRLVADWRPDAIHAHTGLPDGVAAATVGRELGIPVLVSEHASTIEAELADPVALDYYRTLLDPHVRLLAVSPPFAERIARALGVETNRIEILPDPVADDAFPLADASGRDPDELLWVGSLGEHKGIEVLLRAFARVRAARPRARLRLVGRERTAGERARWEALAEALGVTAAVTFDGWLDRGSVAAAIARAAVFVHPSPSETFGVAAAEAILSGLPVAARPSGGVPWIVELSGGYGRVAEGDGVEALAAAIEAVLDDALPVDPTTARARLVESVGEAVVAGQALSHYREAANDGTANGPAPERTAAPPDAPASSVHAPSIGLPRVLVATGRDHALGLVAALPAGLRDRLVLVVPAWQEGATEAPNTEWPIRLQEAARVPPPNPRPRGRGPLSTIQRALYRPAPTGEQLLADALLRAAAEDRTDDRPDEVVAIDAPAAALVARLTGDDIRLAPGALRWLADRWDAEAPGP